MSESPVTRPSLLLRLRDVDDGLAWGEFVALYAPLVYGYSRRAGLQDADAADLAQDVMLAVAQQMRDWSYDAAKGSFRGWLFTIARNRVRNWLSSQARKLDGSGDSAVQAGLNAVPVQAPDEAAWDEEFARRVFHWAARQVRGVVSEQTWRAFEMTAVQGRSGPETATELEMSLAAVYLARSRVMSRLKELVQSVGDDSTVTMGFTGTGLQESL